MNFIGDNIWFNKLNGSNTYVRNYACLYLSTRGGTVCVQYAVCDKLSNP